MEYVPFGASDKIRLSCNIIRRLIAQPTASGKLPDDNQCIKFQMMCQARRLNPFEGDAFMLGYDGKHGPQFSLITAHQAFLKRAELNPEYDGMESGVIVNRGEVVVEDVGDFLMEGDQLIGGWAKVFFKNRSHPVYRRVNLKTFIKDTPVWRGNPAGMIVKCAEADALRSSFPTMLGGLYLKEELADVVEPPRMLAPIFGSPPPAPAPVEAAKTVDSQLETLEALCDRDGVDRKLLIELLQVSGLAGDACNSLADLNPDDLKGTINNWETLVQQLKGNQNDQ